MPGITRRYGTSRSEEGAAQARDDSFDGQDDDEGQVDEDHVVWTPGRPIQTPRVIGTMLRLSRHANRAWVLVCAGGFLHDAATCEALPADAKPNLFRCLTWQYSVSGKSAPVVFHCEIDSLDVLLAAMKSLWDEELRRIAGDSGNADKRITIWSWILD